MNISIFLVSAAAAVASATTTSSTSVHVAPTMSQAKTTTRTFSVQPTSANNIPHLCQKPTASSPTGCQGNLIQIKTSSDPKLLGQLAYLPPTIPPPNSMSRPPGGNLYFTHNATNATYFTISTDNYNIKYLNATQTGRYAFWDPTSEVQNVGNTYAWVVKFNEPLYGSTQVTPSYSASDRAMELEIRDQGSYGATVADAKLTQVCGSSPSRYLVVTTAPLVGCANVTLVWV